MPFLFIDLYEPLLLQYFIMYNVAILGHSFVSIYIWSKCSSVMECLVLFTVAIRQPSLMHNECGVVNFSHEIGINIGWKGVNDTSSNSCAVASSISKSNCSKDD